MKKQVNNLMLLALCLGLFTACDRGGLDPRRISNRNNLNNNGPASFKNSRLVAVLTKEGPSCYEASNYQPSLSTQLEGQNSAGRPWDPSQNGSTGNSAFGQQGLSSAGRIGAVARPMLVKVNEDFPLKGPLGRLQNNRITVDAAAFHPNEPWKSTNIAVTEDHLYVSRPIAGGRNPGGLYRYDIRGQNGSLSNEVRISNGVPTSLVVALKSETLGGDITISSSPNDSRVSLTVNGRSRNTLRFGNNIVTSLAVGDNNETVVISTSDGSIAMCDLETTLNMRRESAYEGNIRGAGYLMPGCKVSQATLVPVSIVDSFISGRKWVAVSPQRGVIVLPLPDNDGYDAEENFRRGRSASYFPNIEYVTAKGARNSGMNLSNNQFINVAFSAFDESILALEKKQSKLFAYSIDSYEHLGQLESDQPLNLINPVDMDFDPGEHTADGFDRNGTFATIAESGKRKGINILPVFSGVPSYDFNGGFVETKCQPTDVRIVPRRR